MVYKQFFSKVNIDVADGLKEEEFKLIEDIYGISFPTELRELYKQVFPLSKGFYDWRNTSPNNVNRIKEAIRRPFDDLKKCISEVEWNENWGNEPESIDVRDKIIIEKIINAPKLIPVFSHRYIPQIEGENVPIISVHEVDIICYGINLNDYLEVEFGNKQQSNVDYSQIREIPFWSDILY